MKLAIKDEEPITDVICFHCQQAAEKYLKAYLISKNVDFGKTHNLEYLVKLCSEIDTEFENVKVGDLSFYAVEVRYPDDFYMPTIDEAKESLKLAKELEVFIKNKLVCKI